MTENKKFNSYVSRSAFNLSLSAPQIRMISALKHRHSWAYCHGPAMTITNALLRKGLIVREESEYPEPNYKLTKAGVITYELCKEANMTHGFDMEFSSEVAA